MIRTSGRDACRRLPTCRRCATAAGPSLPAAPGRPAAAMGLLSIIRKTKLKEHEMRLLLV